MDKIELNWLQIGLLLLGWLSGIATSFASGWINEYFKNRERLATHKRNVASKVLEICHKDPNVYNFFTPGNNNERRILNSTLTDLVAIDIQAGGFLKTYSDTILFGSVESKSSKVLLDSIRKSLIAWANKIRVG